SKGKNRKGRNEIRTLLETGVLEMTVSADDLSAGTTRLELATSAVTALLLQQPARHGTSFPKLNQRSFLSCWTTRRIFNTRTITRASNSASSSSPWSARENMSILSKMATSASCSLVSI